MVPNPNICQRDRSAKPEMFKVLTWIRNRVFVDPCVQASFLCSCARHTHCGAQSVWQGGGLLELMAYGADLNTIGSGRDGSLLGVFLRALEEVLSGALSLSQTLSQTIGARTRQTSQSPQTRGFANLFSCDEAGGHIAATHLKK
eukprot:4356764-Amphidinium_carterae.1